MLVVKIMDVNNINIITLAYLGDAVYEVKVREFLIKIGIAKVIDLQQNAIKYVSANNQSKILDFLINRNILDNIEIEIIKRGRNYKRESHPKNTDIITYKRSTGLEALFGYLYLNNNYDRIDEILDFIFRRYYEENN